MKKFLSIALAVMMVCSLFVFVVSAEEPYNSDVTVITELSKDTINVKDVPATITLTLKTSRPVELFTLSYTVDVPDGWTIENITSGLVGTDNFSSETGNATWYNSANVKTDTFATITIGIPAGQEAGQQDIKINDILLVTYGENNNRNWLTDVDSLATVTFEKDIEVEGVTLDVESGEIYVGETKTLTATVSPADATNPAIKWTSSDDTVATVDANGKITAKKPGTAKITATTVDGGKTATFTVTVKAKPVSVTGVTLNKTKLTLTEGKEETLIATVAPANADNKNVTWASSDNTIATVDGGKVKALKEGKVTIKVITADGNKTATCEVIVEKEQPISPPTGDYTFIAIVTIVAVSAAAALVIEKKRKA